MGGMLGINGTTKKPESVYVDANRIVTYQDDRNTHGGVGTTLINPDTSAVTTYTSAVVTLPAARRTGVLAQWAPDVAGSLPGNGVTLEVQWSPDGGTTWIVAPTSTQGDNRVSTVTSTGQDRSLISRGQVLTGSFRVVLVTTGAAFPAGKTYIFYADIS